LCKAKYCTVTENFFNNIFQQINTTQHKNSSNFSAYKKKKITGPPAHPILYDTNKPIIHCVSNKPQEVVIKKEYLFHTVVSPHTSAFSSALLSDQ
jgi:hypothetical protein